MMSNWTDANSGQYMSRHESAPSRTMTTVVLHHQPCCDTSFCSRHPRQCALISGILCPVLGEEAFPSAAEGSADFPASQFCRSVRRAVPQHLCSSLSNRVKDAVMFCVVCSLSFKYILLKLSPELSCCCVLSRVEQASLL